MLRIGLTGGMGSGKTTVAKIFEVLGIPVYYADEAARRLMNGHSQLRAQIVDAFGPAAYHNDTLDRAYIAAKVFNDPMQLDTLNSIVHPATVLDSEQWMNAQKTTYAIKEAALIFESKYPGQLDYVIGVASPLDLRLSRILLRGSITHDEAMKRIGSQMNEEEKLSRCDFVVQNNESQALIPQVLALHNKLARLDSERTVKD